MINLSSTVFTWWQQQQKTPGIFSIAKEKQFMITIHQVVNLNAGISVGHGKTGNTLSLLQMVRKRGALTTDYLEAIRGDHQVTAWRILRAWQKSQKRG